jgi:hypothetical protein
MLYLNFLFLFCIVFVIFYLISTLALEPTLTSINPIAFASNVINKDNLFSVCTEENNNNKNDNVIF